MDKEIKGVMKKIEKLVSKLEIGKVINIELLVSSQNSVYRVHTTDGIYIIKEFSRDTISNYYSLSKRKEQIRISEILNEKGVSTSLPKIINSKSFIFFNKKYYLLYDYIDNKVLKEEEVRLEHIKELARVQAKIHKLNIDSSLVCFYKTIKIEFNKNIKYSKNIDIDLYNLLVDSEPVLKNYINVCNKNLRSVKKNLCISHNDYKLLNILWSDYKITLLDFDAVGYSNPTCSLCESAFSFSKYNNKINYEYYENYIKSYINEYGKIKDDFLICLYVALNGKLQWLSYMLSRNRMKLNNYIEETKEMLNELVLYCNNIDKFYELFLKVVN